MFRVIEEPTEEQIEAVVLHAHGTMTVDEVKYGLRTHSMWLVENTDLLMGTALDGPVLYIFGYHGKRAAEHLPQLFDFLYQLAKTKGAERLVFSTERRAWERILRGLDGTVQYFFIKEVK